MKKINLVSSAAMIFMTSSGIAFANGGFSGPYAGAQVGYAYGHDSGTEYLYGVAQPYSQVTKPAGGVYGVFGGYNWIVKPHILLGVEADLEGSSQRDTKPQTFNGVIQNRYPVKTEIRSTASLRLRLGYLLGHGNSLIYATGGYAGAEIKSSFTDTSPPGTAVPLTESHSKWFNGATVGVGFEHLFPHHISGKVEYRYTGYQKRTVSVAQVYGPGYEEQQKYYDNSFRLGVAYHF